MQKNKNFDWVVNCARVLTSQCSCQVLRKICIDNSTAKLVSPVVQIYLTGFVTADSLEKTASDC